MSDCCADKACAIEALRSRQSSTLRIVLAINAILFVFEFASGLFARSTALLSDSLDNFGDTTIYALSLYAVSRGARAKARVALFKGGVILLAGAVRARPCCLRPDASSAVWASGAAWPDLVVGAGLAVLLLRSAVNVSRSAIAQLREAQPQHT
jgi:Co/Zn/Cd efflux system component